MTYYNMKEYNLIGYRKSERKNKMYDAVIENKKNKKMKYVPFGDSRYENYHDLTKLNLYPHLTHGDVKRRRLYRARHKKDLKNGYYSPGHFSYYILW